MLFNIPISIAPMLPLFCVDAPTAGVREEAEVLADTLLGLAVVVWLVDCEIVVVFGNELLDKAVDRKKGMC